MTVADSVVFQRRPDQEAELSSAIACRPWSPLAAFEALAMDDYIRTAQIRPCRSRSETYAAQGQSWFVRATSTSAQCSYPIADYAAKNLSTSASPPSPTTSLRPRAAGRLHKVFEDAAHLVQKLFSPLNAPDTVLHRAAETDIDACSRLRRRHGSLLQAVQRVRPETPIWWHDRLRRGRGAHMATTPLGAISSAGTRRSSQPDQQALRRAYRKENGSTRGNTPPGLPLRRGAGRRDQA